MLTSSIEIFKIPWIFVASVLLPELRLLSNKAANITRHCCCFLLRSPFSSPLGRFPNKCELVVGDWEREGITEPQARKISGTSHFKFRGMSWIRLSPQKGSEHFHKMGNQDDVFSRADPSPPIWWIQHFLPSVTFYFITIITILKPTVKVGRLN